MRHEFDAALQALLKSKLPAATWGKERWQTFDAEYTIETRSVCLRVCLSCVSVCVSACLRVCVSVCLRERFGLLFTFTLLWNCRRGIDVFTFTSFAYHMRSLAKAKAWQETLVGKLRDRPSAAWNEQW